MAYITTPDLGLELANPATIQAFETTNVNSNLLLLEAGIVADRVRLTAAEADIVALEAATADSGWLTPTLLNGWVSSSARYRKLNGVVYLRGRLAETSATFNKAFVLPVGYRPAVDLNVVIIAETSFPGSAARCVISADGSVSVDRFVETTKNLDGVSFPVG